MISKKIYNLQVETYPLTCYYFVLASDSVHSVFNRSYAGFKNRIFTWTKTKRFSSIHETAANSEIPAVGLESKFGYELYMEIVENAASE